MKRLEHSELFNLLKLFVEKATVSVGDNLLSIVLFGSYARSLASAESDIDVLILLEVEHESDKELIRDIAYDLMWDGNFQFLLYLHFMELERYQYLTKVGSLFLKNVHEEGVTIWRQSNPKLRAGLTKRTRL